MRGFSKECRMAQRSLASRDSLEAVERATLDLHLKRCDDCQAISSQLLVMEKGPGSPMELSRERRQAIFARLQPAIAAAAVPQAAITCQHALGFLGLGEQMELPQRGQLEAHLSHCHGCNDVAHALRTIEVGPGAVPEISERSRRAIYSRLLPTINEIAHRLESHQARERRIYYRPAIVIGASFAAAAAVMVIALLSSFQTGPLNIDIPKAAVLSREVAIERLQGLVEIDNMPADESAQNGKTRVRKGTRIEIKDSGRMTFSIDQVAKVALAGKSDWRMSSVSETFLGMQLDRGRLAVEFDGHSGQLMEVSTPDSIVRVKGTTFTVEATESGETKVSVLEGIVEVVSRHGELRSVDVGQGQLIEMPGISGVTDLTDEQRALAAELRSFGDYPEGVTRIVQFDGTPERVRVEVDGRVLGTAPLSVRLPEGKLAYRLTAPGMEPVTGELEKERGREEVRYHLFPEDAAMDVIGDLGDIEEELPSTPGKTHKRGHHGRSKRLQTAGMDSELFAKAQQAMREGDITRAIGLLKRIVEQARGRELIVGLSALAECYGAIGEYGPAARSYERITELVPSSGAAQNARYEVGRLAMDQLGQLARARAAFTAYVASPLGGPLREEAYFSLCELEGRSGNHRDSLHCFNEFLRAFPGGHKEPVARLWRGALSQDVERRWAEAERDLQAFIKARPSHPRVEEARYRIALGRFQSGDERGALRMIDEYLNQHKQGKFKLRVERLRVSILEPQSKQTRS